MTARNGRNFAGFGERSSTRQLRIRASENSTYQIIIDRNSSVYPDFERLFPQILRSQRLRLRRLSDERSIRSRQSGAGR